MDNFDRHNKEIGENIDYWAQKPILRVIYNDFYSLIVSQVNKNIDGKIVEIGSGIGNLKQHLPECICTDAFDNPWIDQKENAYKLSFADSSVSNLIIFDVFHHLEYPKNALDEFQRVLKPKGRVIIFEPYISLLGMVVYGAFHKEDVALFSDINTNDNTIDIDALGYYAAQGNATRIFNKKKYQHLFADFDIIKKEKMAATAYVMSGGYSGKQLYADKSYPTIKKIETFANKIPFLFATRLLVVLEKK